MSKYKEVEIYGIAKGGDGVGRLDDGRVIFVPQALPNERVQVKVIQSKKSYARGRITCVINESPERIDPSCDAYTRGCGGCQFWHTTYANELELKVQAAIDSIERIGKVTIPSPQIFASPLESHYRNKVTFHQLTQGGKSNVGFYKVGSNDIVPTEQCPISQSLINQAYKVVRRAISRLGSCDFSIETATSDQVVVRFTVNSRHADEGLWASNMAQLIASTTILRGVSWTIEGITRVVGEMSIESGKLLANSPAPTTTISESLFRQVNDEINKILADYIRSIVARNGRQKVLELYCGAGNISFALTDDVEELWGIEGNEVAIQQASSLTELAGLTTYHFQVGDLTEGFEAYRQPHWPSFNVAILDPPRQGATKVCEQLAQMQSLKSVVYISCDPACLARDIKTFDQQGWSMDSIAFLDMFPRTSHIETVVVLER